MKSKLLIITGVLLICQSLLAVEGMYLLNDLPLKQMRKAGLKIRMNVDKETGYPEIAAGIVNLNGSSASLISRQGLVLTNHHVAFGGIQRLSTLQDNILENGFIAENHENERFIPGFRASITVSFEDVTDEILKNLPADMDPGARYDSVQYRIKRVIAREETGLEKIFIRSFYNGKSYFLVRRLEFNDVRLVYTPPRSIGEFGGDIDNWMWPRHTGDFTIVRIYAGPDNLPADYSPDNEPFKPSYFFPISAKGLKPGDFTMILGYPGMTQRYLTAREAAFEVNREYPESISHYKTLVGIMDSLGENNPEIALKLSSRIKGLNNYRKKYEGMLEGFKKHRVVNEKEQLEQNLVKHPQMGSEIEAVLQELSSLQDDYENSYDYHRRFDRLRGDSRLLAAAYDLTRWNLEKSKPDPERESGYQARDYDRRKQYLDYFMFGYDETLDKILLNKNINASLDAIDAERIKALDILLPEKDDSLINSFIDKLYSETQLANDDFRRSLLDMSPEEFSGLTDPMIRFARLLEEQAAQIREENKQISGKKMVLMPRYFDALKSVSETAIYPDANGTLRCTYGHVEGYSPADGIFYKPFTTLPGILEKESGEYPFYVEAFLKKIKLTNTNRPFYDSRLNNFPVNFLHSMDITNGNSGSAVFNSRGHLVGTAFDGNYEAMTSDWIYNDKLTRAISADIRYMLLVLTETPGSENLLQELTIIY